MMHSLQHIKFMIATKPVLWGVRLGRKPTGMP
jgi:hypothetical protein